MLTNKGPFLNKFFLYFILLLFSAYFLFPLIVMISTSLKELKEIQQGNLLAFPHRFNFSSWISAWEKACIGTNCQGLRPHFINSILITIPAVLISTFIGSINGFILTKWQFKGHNFIFTLILFGCFIPLQSIIIPIARVLFLMGLSNSLLGLTLIHTIYGLAFTTLYFRNYYINIPNDLIKAAKIDGANFFQIFVKIILPLSPPIFMVCFIWQFTHIWNDFLFGVTLTSGENQPLMVALNNLVSTTTGVKIYNVDMAASMIAAAPTLILYILAGKFFVRGLTAGAIKE